MQAIIIFLAATGLGSLVAASVIPPEEEKPISVGMEDLSEVDGLEPIQGGLEADLKTISGSEYLDNVTELSGKQYDLCNCGRSPLQLARIVGGVEARQGEFPWRVYVGVTKRVDGEVGDYMCGGTILSPRWVLTAAHCFNEEVHKVEVLVGDINRWKPQPIGVARRIDHENYKKGPGIKANDISLLELTEDLDFNNPQIGPACLPYQLQGDFEVARAVMASGWGDCRYKFQAPDPMLHKVKLDVIANSKCKQIWRYGDTVQNTQMCTLTPRKDTCQGDSGGSIDAKLNGKWHALGVVSFGYQCAVENMPGVYTRVSEYIDWIEEKTNQKYCRT